MIDIPLERVTFRIWKADYVETIFDDGTKVPAAPQIDSDYARQAHELGYTDVNLMMREHELLHTLLSQANGLPFSPTLWHVAHKDTDKTTLEYMYAEEKRVLDAQRVLNIVRNAK